MKLAPDAPTGLGAAMAGGKRPAVKTVRRDFDYYQTPPQCTAAFLASKMDEIKAAFGDGFNMTVVVWPKEGFSGSGFALSNIGIQATVNELVRIDTKGGAIGVAKAGEGVDMRSYAGRQIQ